MIKRLLSDSIIYGLAGIMARVVGFILLPIYSKILAPEDYGILGLYNSSFYLLFVLLVFGLDSATFRFFYDSTKENIDRTITSTWFWTQMLMSLILLFLVIVFSNNISNFFFGGYKDGKKILFAMVGVLFLYALPNIQEVWFRIRKKPWQAFSFALLISLVNIASTLYFIVYERSGFWGFIYGQLISYGLGTVISIFLLRHQILPKAFDFTLLKKMLKFGAPLVPAWSMSIGITWVCNFFITNGLGFGEAGLYNMGNTFAMIMTLVTGSFAQAYLPFAYSIIDEKNAKDVYANVFLIYVAALSTITFGYGLFAKDILIWITDPKYFGSSIVMIILSYHYFFSSLSTFGNLGSSIAKRSAPFAYAVAVGFGLSTLLIWILTSKFGKEGTAFGLLIGQICVPVITFYYSNKVFPVKFDFVTGISLITFSILLSILAHFVNQTEYTFYGFIIKVSILLVFLIFVILLLKKKKLILQKSGI